MAIKRLPLFFFLSFVLLSATLCLGYERDPEREKLEQCRLQFQQQARSKGEQRECEQRCQKQYEEQHGQKEEEKGRREDPREDPRVKLEKCRRQCQQQAQSREKQRECEQRCQQKYEERQQGRGNRQEEERNNPYYFSSQSFQTVIRNQEGQVLALPKFTKKSDLLRHIERYRLGVCEANPHAFVIPHHLDSETILFVVQGRGTITLVKQNKRESFNIERGDVLKVDAGTTMYVINRDSNERVRTVSVAQSQNVPGDTKIYFGAGGENPETFYKTFSDEVLEAAFNTPSDRLQKLFGKQTQGAAVKATEEQIKALTQHAQSSKGGKSKGEGPFNLLQSRPVHSNKFGQFFEVTPNDCKDLQDLDSSVSFVKINQGGMMAPFFNSKSTKIVYVVEGNGCFEMACPHVASQSQGSQTRKGVTESTSYKKLYAHLSRGDALVIPAGHPVTFIADQNQNLQLVSFGINAQNNKRNFLAGQENVLNQLEKEAKELSFNTRAEEVEEIFKNQKDSYFVAGPKEFEEREEKGGRGQRLSSILDFAAF
ncbi:Cupin 1 [Dillenia turbinata]|uniref:Cupin 1 n=1 Tax=Dillenia turbinata TaxID=194707 RepID=A0AAN8YUU6_9MAGN